MKFLLDTNPPDVQRLSAEHPDFVLGQLICPVHSRANWGGVFAMDNTQDQRRRSRPLHPLVRWRRKEVERWD